MGKQPDYDIKTPVEGDNDTTYWQKIGAAWEKGGILKCQINCYPITGSFILAPRETSGRSEDNVKG